MALSESLQIETEKSQVVEGRADHEKRDGSVELINASGHKQELERNFSLVSLCTVAITTGNTWVAIGGSVSIALYNGGPPGVIYEFIVVSVFYWIIAASIAELASAMPSASGVYHWASITAGRRYGRVCGWFAGWWNFLAWIFGAASISSFLGNQLVSMYAIFHPDFMPQPWHVFLAYIICTWISCATVLFANRALPVIGDIGGFLIIAGVFLTIVVCAVMPHVNGTSYASNSFVWTDWQNQTGYSSDGFVFVAGMLNGAFAVGTSDCVSHLAEEIPKPSKNVPKAIFYQMLIGFVTALLYLVAIFYAVSDLSTLSSVGTFPLAGIYLQATGTQSGAVGLLVVAFLPTFITCIGCYITSSRVLWALARDKATPFPQTLAHVSPRFHNPFTATVVCGVVCTVLGCIYVGNTTAFNAFVGSYVILSTLSYLAAILPHMLTRRALVTPGPFWMSGITGYVVNGISCAYIVVFVVIFCFPFSMPVAAANMNYASLMSGGLSIFIAAWWFWRRKNYVGPVMVDVHELADEAM